jgi:hypothetical protein
MAIFRSLSQMEREFSIQSNAFSYAEFRNLERFLFWVADRFVLRYKLE